MSKQKQLIMKAVLIFIALWGLRGMIYGMKYTKDIIPIMLCIGWGFVEGMIALAIIIICINIILKIILIMLRIIIKNSGVDV